MSGWISHRISGLFSGNPTPPPNTSSKRGKRGNDYTAAAAASAASAAAATAAGGAPRSKAGKRDQGIHGIISSAMWAVARTPALADAVERVESSDGAATPLSHALRSLRDADLSDPPRLRQAIEAADAFLQDSRLLIYDAMEPMDAIRGIVGLCGDSARVLEEAVSSVYRWVLTAFPSVAPSSGEDARISRLSLCPAGAVQVQVLLFIWGRPDAADAVSYTHLTLPTILLV